MYQPTNSKTLQALLTMIAPVQWLLLMYYFPLVRELSTCILVPDEYLLHLNTCNHCLLEGLTLHPVSAECWFKETVNNEPQSNRHWTFTDLDSLSLSLSLSCFLAICTSSLSVSWIMYLISALSPAWCCSGLNYRMLVWRLFLSMKVKNLFLCWRESRTQVSRQESKAVDHAPKGCGI